MLLSGRFVLCKLLLLYTDIITVLLFRDSHFKAPSVNYHIIVTEKLVQFHESRVMFPGGEKASSLSHRKDFAVNKEQSKEPSHVHGTLQWQIKCSAALVSLT